MSLFHGLIGGTVITATEIVTRLIRKRVLGMPAGSLVANATELGISTGLGLIAQHTLPAPYADRGGQLIIDGGVASVERSLLKSTGWAFVSDALADDGPRKVYVVRNGKVIKRDAMAGYVKGGANARMNGYVSGRDGKASLGGYVRGQGSASDAASMYAAGGRSGAGG